MQLTQYKYTLVVILIFSIILVFNYSYFGDVLYNNSLLSNIYSKISNESSRTLAKIPIEKPNDEIDYDFFDFEGFDNNDNTTNFTRIIVPNIVHLIYLNMTEIKFYQMANIFSIFVNSRPDKIFIHCNNCSFHGPYWEQILKVEDLVKIISIKQVVYHNTIFGTKTEVIHHVYNIF